MSGKPLKKASGQRVLSCRTHPLSALKGLSSSFRRAPFPDNLLSFWEFSLHVADVYLFLTVGCRWQMAATPVTRHSGDGRGIGSRECGDGDRHGFQYLRGMAQGHHFAAFQHRKFLGGSAGFDAFRCDAANSMGVAVGWKQPLKRRLADDRRGREMRRGQCGDLRLKRNWRST